MKKIVFQPAVYIIAVFAAVILFLFRPYFFGHKILFPSNLLVIVYAPWKYERDPQYPYGPPNKPIGFDDIRQFFPNRKLLSESLAKGIIPLWNPYLYSGAPFMASFDTAVWYPLSWIAALMPAVEGWNFLVIVQPVLSLFFMYLFLKSLRFDLKICTFGAFAYAFSGWMIVYWQEILVLEHSFLWLPLALYASNRKDRLGFFLLILSLVCSIFGGFLQMSIYVYIIVLLWNIFVVKSKRVYTAIVLSLCIAAIQLIPSIESFFLSPRGTENGLSTFSNALLPWQHLVTLIVPDFWGNPGAYNYFGFPGFYFEKMVYIGIIPLVFAIYGLLEQKEKGSGFWRVSAIVALSMGFTWPASWLPYILRIPILSNSYPTRIFAVYVLSAAVLACYGLRSFLAVPNRRRLTWILLSCTAVLAALWVWAGWMHVTISLRNLVVPSALLFASWFTIMLSKYFRKAVYFFALTLMIISSVYFAQKYLQFSDRRFVYPDLPVIDQLSRIAGYDRVWGYGNAYIEKDFPQYFGWFSTDGYGSLSSKRYAELLSTIVNGGKLGGVIRRSDTDLYEIPESESMVSNPYRLRMMSLLGIKYILEIKQGEGKKLLSSDMRFPGTLFQLVWEDDVWRIWEYKDALPRVIFATNYIVKSSPQDIVAALYDLQVNLGDTVILEEDPGVKLSPKITSARADIVSYDLNSVTIRTDSDSDGFVILSDNYYPGWIASVDGRKEKLLRADYSFKSVFVPKGLHTVVFRYKPVSLTLGFIITLLGIAGAMIYCVKQRE